MLNIKKVDENNFFVKKIGKYSIFITKIDSLYQGVYNYEIKVTDDFIAYWYDRSGWDRIPNNKKVVEFCEKILPILDLFQDSRTGDWFFYNAVDYYNNYYIYDAPLDEFYIYIIDLTNKEKNEITIHKRKLNLKGINSPFGKIKLENCLRVNL